MKKIALYLMNKHVFFGIIPVKSNLKFTKRKSGDSREPKIKMDIPVYESISVPHIEPFHCALN